VAAATEAARVVAAAAPGTSPPAAEGEREPWQQAAAWLTALGVLPKIDPEVLATFKRYIAILFAIWFCVYRIGMSFGALPVGLTYSARVADIIPLAGPLSYRFIIHRGTPLKATQRL
jgi:hypothetical protein